MLGYSTSVRRLGRIVRPAIAALLLCSPLAARAADSPAGHEEDTKAAAGFELSYEEPTNPAYADIEQALEDSAVFEHVLDDINSYLALPKPIPVVFRECEESNAWYDPEAEDITLCYNLIDDFRQAFAAAGKKPQEVSLETIQAMQFIFYHEMGHALIAQLDLPVTGKEEDAVDDLATLVLINADADKEGETMALSAAESFYISGEQEAEQGDAEPAYWDEHSLDLQRYYNIVCTVYGSDEKAFADLVEDGDLPEERAERCASEYEQKERSWGKLLEPHLKSHAG